MASRLPKNADHRAFFCERALSDTGFFARNVLGMDTDRDKDGNANSGIGEGGVRDYGPHKQMVDFFDDETEETTVLWAPRYSYKSSVVKAFITRKVLAHPNIAILLYMHDYEEAEERSAQIRDSLLENETIVEMFGNLKGSVWQRKRWTTSMRSDKSTQQPTLTVSSPKKAKAGGRFNIIIFDDIVPENAPESDATRKEGIRCIERSLNLKARGTLFKQIGTPYHTEDANHWTVNAGWKACIDMDVGCEVVKKEDGTLGLEGKTRWPNLPLPFLEWYLKKGMSYELFMSQFMLRVVTGMTEAFKRTQFQPISWADCKKRNLTGYLLNDKAPSGSERGDFNVLIYVGIDERQRVHILDIEIGHWQMYEFCQRYLDMLGRWSGRVTHRCEVWEEDPSFHTYKQHLEISGRAVGRTIRVEGQKRNQHEKGKRERIAGLALRFQALEVFVSDTVPRLWNTGKDLLPLWEPEGHIEIDSRTKLPGGDLVTWFVQFPGHPKKDVPDCLALVDAMSRETHTRVCYWVRPSQTGTTESQVRLPAQRTEQRSRGSAQRFYDRCHNRGGQ